MCTCCFKHSDCRYSVWTNSVKCWQLFGGPPNVLVAWLLNNNAIRLCLYMYVSVSVNALSFNISSMKSIINSLKVCFSKFCVPSSLSSFLLSQTITLHVCMCVYTCDNVKVHVLNIIMCCIFVYMCTYIQTCTHTFDNM